MYKYLFFFILFTASVFSSIAQDSVFVSDSLPVKDSITTIIPDRNFIKLNLLALPLRNFSLQYEHALSKRFSVALGFRFMPDGSLPLLSSFESFIGIKDPEVQNAFRSVNIRNLAITPEARWYPSKKGYGRGLYIAAYYRYFQIDISSSNKFQVELDNSIRNMTLNMNLQAHNFGLMFGGQWMLSKRLFLDWWIMGAQLGWQTGEFIFSPDQEFSDAQINEINNRISINFTKLGQTTLINKQAVIIGTNSFLELTGLRTGLCLGVRF